MIGQHPQIYGFPELHTFIGDTVEEVLDKANRAGKHFSPPGLSRTVAQVEFGNQTRATVARAIGWLYERRHWSTKALMDHLLARVAPKIGMEKSPTTTLHKLNMERAWTYYPKSLFLHLTRHPVSSRSSMTEWLKENRPNDTTDRVDTLLSWYRIHQNILEFTHTLPPGQSLMVKGEQLLSSPDRYLRQIAEWLGLRTDPDAITAMKHPEHSPYAFIGPPLGEGGNDIKFLRSPVLQHRQFPEPSLAEFFSQDRIDWAAQSKQLGGGDKKISKERLIEEISSLTHRLGYS